MARPFPTILAALMISTMTPAAPTQAQDPCRQYVDLARQLGWPRSERANLERVMRRESKCRPTATNPNDPGGSYGLMQINWYGNGRYLENHGIIRNKYDLYNPTRNLKAALTLWKLYGWRPWAGSSSAP